MELNRFDYAAYAAYKAEHQEWHGREANAQPATPLQAFCGGVLCSNLGLLHPPAG